MSKDAFPADDCINPASTVGGDVNTIGYALRSFTTATHWQPCHPSADYLEKGGPIVPPDCEVLAKKGHIEPPLCKIEDIFTGKNALEGFPILMSTKKHVEPFRHEKAQLCRILDASGKCTC
uniref:AlNc14C478G11878 protein n=1 Tax=Albugo laibachii Nc14 TaxID=890382 RepID=F0X0D9_9STRA|nr:AlNc14C478G11878 [Albugo laibachii Nc14]|eukprot:CCA27224.1 AlNc14C478G11878 [Albugo laibachii Nc14]